MLLQPKRPGAEESLEQLRLCDSFHLGLSLKIRVPYLGGGGGP